VASGAHGASVRGRPRHDGTIPECPTALP
jgi:hypothetical protein